MSTPARMVAPTSQRPAKTAGPPSFTPTRSPLLQRRCRCGGTPGPSGECEECRRKRLSLQRKPRPGGAAMTVNQPSDRYEQEADRVAAAVVAGDTARPAVGPRMVQAVERTAGPAGIQRQPASQPPSEAEKYGEAAKKAGEAFLQTEVGHDLKRRVEEDKLVAGAKRVGEGFIATLPGKIITGAAVVGVVAGLAASHKELPAQLPAIPLDSLTPGLSATLTYEGPADQPTKAMLTLTYREPAAPGPAKTALTPAERYRADTARMAADQARFRAGLRYTPGSPEADQQKAEDAALARVVGRMGGLLAADPLAPRGPSALGGTGAPALFTPSPASTISDALKPGPPPASAPTPATPVPATPSEPRKKEDETPVMRKAAESAALGTRLAPPIVHAVLRSPGRPLDPVTRAFMESRFGYDFSRVRIHDDAPASASAGAVNALAYTVGQAVVFAAGQYNPTSEAGRRLLAHELVHTIQQGAAQPGVVELAPPALDERLEREADASAALSTTPGARLDAPETPKGPTSRAAGMATGAGGEGAGAAPALTSISSTRPVLSRQVGGREWTAVPRRRRTINVRGLGALTFNIDQQQDGPGTIPDNVPRAVALRVDRLYLPVQKGDVLSIYNDRAQAGALETTIDYARNPRVGLWQSRTPTSPPPLDPSASSLRENWLQKVQWRQPCSGSLWFRAGGNPRAGTPNAPTPPNVRVNASDLPRVRGETCHVDHIIELQLGGTNVPNNLQMLDPADNQAVGSAIWRQVLQLSNEIRDVLWPDDPKPVEVTLHFESVRMMGGAVPTCPPNACAPVAKGRATTCFQVECCARQMSDATRQEVCGTGGGAAASANIEPYTIRAGGTTANLLVPGRTASDARIELGAQQSTPASTTTGTTTGGGATPASPAAAPLSASAAANRAAAELIPGLILERLNYRRMNSSQPDTIDAALDERQFAPQRNRDRRAQTRLTTALRGAQLQIVFTRDANNGQLRLRSPGQRLSFVYPYLSEAWLQLAQDGAGDITGRGEIRPSLPLLRNAVLNFTLERGRLVGNIPIPQGAIQPPIPGFYVTRSELGIELSPQFRPYGALDFTIGPRTRPVFDGSLMAEADENGFVARGRLNAHLPKVNNAEGNIEYRNRQWTGSVEINSTQIGIPGIQSGSLRVDFSNRGPEVTGRVLVQLPGGQNAELGVRRQGGVWIYSGRGTLDLPGLRPVNLDVVYDGQQFTGTAQTTFQLYGLNGDLTVRYRDGRVTGEGTLAINRGRARGTARMRLRETLRLSGEGQLEYQLADNLVGMLGVVIPERGPVHVTGGITVPRPITLFRRIQSERELFHRSLDIPIVGVPIGPVSIGLVARITGGLSVRYGVGPGELRNIRVLTALNPLEPNPDLELEAGAQLVIPAYAGLSVSIRGGLGVSVGIASVTGGIVATGTAELRGGLDAGVALRYRRNIFVVDASAAIRVSPLFRLALDADLIAEAGALGLAVEYRKAWRLAAFEYGSNLQFGMVVPIHYANNEPFRMPSYGDMQWIVPQIDPMDAVRTMVGRARTSETQGR